MKDQLRLEDLSLFLHVAEGGSLTAAAGRSGVSLPTLGRRMARLEEQSGRRLFRRGAEGYALTADGRSLAREAAALRAVEADIGRWRNSGPQARHVRITAGFWTARFLARNIRRIWCESDGWTPDFLAASRVVDIARREADIGIRNRSPEQDWLAGRRTGRVRYAEYGTGPEVTGLIALPRDLAATRSERWLWEHRAAEVCMLASDQRLALDLAGAGIGRVLLPCFIGKAEAGLCRLGDPVAELEHEEWLVCHHEARHDPPVRAALEAISALLNDARLRPPPGP